MENETLIEDFEGITISSSKIEDLLSAGKWARYLSIVGMIFVSFGLLIFIIMNILSGGIPGIGGQGMTVLPAVLGLFISLIYIFPLYNLYKFGTKVVKGVNNHDTYEVSESFSHLNKTLKFIGVLTIILFGIYILIGLIIMLTGF